MIERVDHVVMAVRDLERAADYFRTFLGLDVRDGGRHTGQGTYNAIARFGLDYLELISVYDRTMALASGPRGQALVDFLDRHEGGLLGYCLASEDLDGLASQMRRSGLESAGPFGMERVRPDGRTLRWQLLVPGGVAWRRPWPFFIRWEVPDRARLAWEAPGAHPLGALALGGLAVAVRDLRKARDLYGSGLGLPALQGAAAVPELAASRSAFRLGGFLIELLSPAGPGAVRSHLDERGEGPYQLLLRVRSIQRATDWLRQRGIEPEPLPSAPGVWLIPPERAIGARIAIEVRLPARVVDGRGEHRLGAIVVEDGRTGR